MAWAQTIEQLVPLTVLTAVVLFVTKETIEAIRRYKGKSRKAAAIQALLVEEMELNYRTIKSLRVILETIQRETEKDRETEFWLKTDASGASHFRFRRPETTGSSGTAIPRVHRDHFDTFLPELAEIDKALFKHVREGYEPIGELEHVRRSLIALLAEEDPDEKHLDGFTQYGLKVLQGVEERMRKLYLLAPARPLLNLGFNDAQPTLNRTAQ